MKRKVSCIIGLIMIVALSACGPAPTPTLSIEDIQNTAVALAMRDVAMTLTALPTATPLPPTPSPTIQPTFTPFPTFAPIATSVSIGNVVEGATSDPCSEPVDFKPQGGIVEVKLANKSGGSVNLALGMIQPNKLGECGIYSFSISTFGAPVVKIMAGCYWGYAWVSGKKPSTAQTISSLCFTDTNQVTTITIGSEVIAID